MPLSGNMHTTGRPSFLSLAICAAGSGKKPLINDMTELLNKAGYEVIFPEKMENLCCGTIWESKGMPDEAARKAAELELALLKASDNGRWPILCDQSPCLHRMRHLLHTTHYSPLFLY